MGLPVNHNRFLINDDRETEELSENLIKSLSVIKDVVVVILSEISHKDKVNKYGLPYIEIHLDNKFLDDEEYFGRVENNTNAIRDFLLFRVL